ncbi:MAG: hypothetical protein AB3N14_06795 [Flavobacteriaceae bacterium]
MPRIITAICLSFLLYASSVSAQEMNPEKLKELITQVSDTLQHNGNSIQFLYKEKMLVCIYDENANRMRIISPIIERKNLEEEQLLNALVANYHSALDVKYALSDEIIWSVFTHPLAELYEHQLLDAINQVWAAAATFGTTYSSTHLVFPGNSKKKEKAPPKKVLKKT